MIEKTIQDGIKIYQKRSRTDKNKRIINNSNKIINTMELFKSMIDNNEFVIPGEYNDKPNNNIDSDWMIDKDGYEEIAEGVDSDYMKGKNDNELKLIKDFITKINNGTINNKNKVLRIITKINKKKNMKKYKRKGKNKKRYGTINNKNKAENEFRKLKQKVTNDILRQDLIKYLEKYLFGEEKYEKI